MITFPVVGGSIALALSEESSLAKPTYRRPDSLAHRDIWTSYQTLEKAARSDVLVKSDLHSRTSLSKWDSIGTWHGYEILPRIHISGCYQFQVVFVGLPRMTVRTR